MSGDHTDPDGCGDYPELTVSLDWLRNYRLSQAEAWIRSLMGDRYPEPDEIK